MINKYKNLEEHIKVAFKNRKLLENVFVHRSFLNEHKSYYLPSNEKLEFLGDSVLSLITSIYLYKNYPDLNEGTYTDIKASIVRTESLAEVAKELNLGAYLYLSKGEELNKGRSNINILADCFESLVAGIFIDQSFDHAYDFIVRFLFKETSNTIKGHLKNIVDKKLYLSPKSRLQEYVQNQYKILPVYKIVEETGPEHLKNFKVAVFINKRKLAVSSGKSKKEAEEKAAKIALEKIKI